MTLLGPPASPSLSPPSLPGTQLITLCNYTARAAATGYDMVYLMPYSRANYLSTGCL
jgi:hypothetical protein